VMGNGVSNGNLVNSPSLLILPNAALVFNEASAVTFNPVIFDSGSLVQNGPGTVTLTQNEFGPAPDNLGRPGIVFIDGGTLALAAGSSLSLSQWVQLQNNGNTAVPPTFDISNGGAQSLQYLTGGPNTFVSLGANTLTIGVAGQSYHTVAPLLFTSDFAGTISGAGGGLTFQGSDVYVLGGVNTYTGLTTVAAGTLLVGDAKTPGAQIAGDALVDAGATLGGAGTIFGSVANNGTLDNNNNAFLASGLAVGGAYTQSAGANLIIGVTPTTITTLTVGGTASLAGTVTFAYAPGTYTAKTYTFLQSGGLNGSQFNIVAVSTANPLPTGFNQSAAGIAATTSSAAAGIAATTSSAAAGIAASAIAATAATTSSAAAGIAATAIAATATATAAGRGAARRCYLQRNCVRLRRGQPGLRRDAAGTGGAGLWKRAQLRPRR